jgi:hypothetical protein
MMVRLVTMEMQDLAMVARLLAGKSSLTFVQYQQVLVKSLCAINVTKAVSIAMAQKPKIAKRVHFTQHQQIVPGEGACDVQILPVPLADLMIHHFVFAVRGITSISITVV